MKAVVMVAVLISASVLFGLLGLTAGINLNPQSTVKFVPDWGSVGDWVSGVGALLAVIASFVIVQRNERFQLARDDEQLVLNQEPEFAWLTLYIGCKGMRSCTVTDVKVCYAKRRRSIKHALSDKSSGKFPSRLDPGEFIQLDWSGIDFTQLLQVIGQLEVKNPKEIFIEVITGISVHRFDLDVATVSTLEEASEMLSISLTKQDDEVPF